MLLFLQVVLEGLWQQGYMALAAIGATNIGSIQVFLAVPYWCIIKQAMTQVLALQYALYSPILFYSCNLI